MKKLTTGEIREKFIQFFEKNQHLKIATSSLLPQNDPTLLYINSGMAPLKSYFLGLENPPRPNLCNFQPCIRTKDIDDVGDRHHLTIFEMLGSWSIGDYYKEKACALAYDLLVNEFCFDPKLLYVTVYSGNKDKNLAPDTESAAAWIKAGIDKDHIIPMGDDNFWGPAGDVGPCGPCTEVFFDTGAEFGADYVPGGHFDDESRFLEIWNAGVFMELNKQKDGSFQPLPFNSVDTGSGLERMAMVMNGFKSVYETDLVAPIVEIAQALLNFTPAQKKSQAEIYIRKYRMIADHMRAAVMILSEGVTPSHEGRGYIPRKLIRKVVASLVSSGSGSIDLSLIAKKVIELMSAYYPLLNSAREMILYNIENEVKEFVPIIKKGLELIDEDIIALKKGELFSGQKVFELVTTHGLPLEIIAENLKHQGVQYDVELYEKCYNEHRATSRVISRKGGRSVSDEKLELLLKALPKCEFVGYSDYQAKSAILLLMKEDRSVESVALSDEFIFVTQATPFYAESGGQVGDTGKIELFDALAEVSDTEKVNGYHIHHGRMLSGKFSKNDEVSLFVDESRRRQIMGNHSATHLLHSALHEVIGKHATQKGSHVSFDRLRFDFQHNQSVPKESLERVETLVNAWIINNNSTQMEEMAYEAALDAGAMALFGEKYDKDVRVIFLGKSSVELCGGTHVASTGDIGPFIITSETSVAKGVRRIEAVTGLNALKVIQDRNRFLQNSSLALNVKPEDLATRIKDLKKQLAKKSQKPKAVAVDAKSIAYTESAQVEIADKKAFVAAIKDTSVDHLKAIGDDLINQQKYAVVALLTADDKSLKACVWVEKKTSAKVKAGTILNQIIGPLGGKGGGRPHFAQGGAPAPQSLSEFVQNLAKTL